MIPKNFVSVWRNFTYICKSDGLLILLHFLIILQFPIIQHGKLWLQCIDTSTHEPSDQAGCEYNSKFMGGRQQANRCFIVRNSAARTAYN
jgi:hypothetical protein